jgi:primosomal protein N' (replication factor Y)
VLVEVALPVPVPRTFTYQLDDGPVPHGTRVRVPFSGRRLVGWVVGETDSGRAPDRVRSIERVLDERPSVTAELLRVCRWIAGYYVTPLGVVLRAAVPAVLSHKGRDAPPVRTQRVLRLVAELPTLGQRDEVFGRSGRQRECFELLESLGGSAASSYLRERGGFSDSVLRGLVGKGLAEIVDVPVLRDPFADIPTGSPGTQPLTADQKTAVDLLLAAARLEEDGPGTPLLLHGVTGSGKTRVYIELLREVVVEQGRGAIVLVPEISLTPQTVARFRAHFGDRIAVLHSALSDGERYDAWRALRDGQRTIAIGARSAVFAPVRDLGAIVVDEEHEATYKQAESPRYHAREVAVMRAHFASAVCVLGSATPSLESHQNAQLGKYRRIALPVRIGGLPLPPVRTIDLRRDRPKETGAAASLSVPLIDAVRLRLSRSEQTILLLNRRGYSTFVQCRDCGHVWQCADCNVALTFHRGRRRLLCHYCFHEEHAPSHCSQCGSGDIAFLGIGTEQVEREVAEHFPEARIARMDVDTTSAKWSHHEILARVGHGEVDILLGTQMIAKGLDFPNVTLVGVINADVGMNLPDFRATERTFQLLTQVAGRAGRGPAGGEVLVQTALPGHYVIRCAAEHDYGTFAERELAEREPAGYPPHSRMVNVVVSGTAEVPVQEAVGDLAAWTREALRERSGVTLTGPAPCPIDRIRGRWRWHFLLRSTSARSIGRIVRMIQYRYEMRSGSADLRLVIDRDPVTLL